MTHPQSDLVTPEVLEKIRSENQRLHLATQSMEASIETGRLAEAIFIAAELVEVLRKQVFLVDRVLDVLTPDDGFNRQERTRNPLHQRFPIARREPSRNGAGETRRAPFHLMSTSVSPWTCFWR